MVVRREIALGRLTLIGYGMAFFWGCIFACEFWSGVSFWIDFRLG